MQKLGDILINMGSITPDQLDVALIEQKIVGKRLGEYLVCKSIISEETLVEALAKQFSYDIVSLGEENIDYELLSPFSVDFLRDRKLLPYKGDAEKVYIALADPVDIAGMTEVSDVLGKRTVGLLCVESDVMYYIDDLESMRALNMGERVASLEKRVAYIEKLLQNR